MKAATRAEKIKQNCRDSWHREQNQFKKGDGASDSRSQQKMQNSQQHPGTENGYESESTLPKAGEPLDPTIHRKNDRVGGEHLMQEARNSRRQLKLLAAEVTEADTAEQGRKLTTKEGKERVGKRSRKLNQGAQHMPNKL